MPRYINPYTDFGFKKPETFDEIPAILREPIFEKAFHTAKVSNQYESGTAR
ncbi:MAG: hypothetical protein R3C61_20380 [Bacteroidia bacterium]